MPEFVAPLIASPALLAGALWLALLVDHWLGEPPARWHPVVWMGRYLGWAGSRIAPQGELAGQGADWPRFGLGALAWGLGAATVFAAALLLQHWILAWHPVAAVLLLGLLLKPLLAWSMLRREVLAVEQALGISLDAGRARLAGLVSRDVRALSACEVRESAIESLAENLNDSVVAPIFWFLLLGLPGAALYRYANTADAMWGYRGLHGGRDWTWAGKWAARADDVLSWLPARLTAVLLAAVHGGLSPARLRPQARRTPSPNSGWPMAAMALALGVQLRKPGVYVLHETGRAPQARDTARAAVLGARVVALLSALSLAAWLAAAFVAREVGA
jgi:adenosylcobinamide-phosphate synthase